jgi:hypothetical protein
LPKIEEVGAMIWVFFDRAEEVESLVTVDAAAVGGAGAWRKLCEHKLDLPRPLFVQELYTLNLYRKIPSPSSAIILSNPVQQRQKISKIKQKKGRKIIK